MRIEINYVHFLKIISEDENYTSYFTIIKSYIYLYILDLRFESKII